MLLQILNFWVDHYIEKELLVFEVSNFDICLFVLEQRFDDWQPTLVLRLLGLGFVAALHNQLNRWRNINLHRMNCNLQPVFILELCYFHARTFWLCTQLTSELCWSANCDCVDLRELVSVCWVLITHVSLVKEVAAWAPHVMRLKSARSCSISLTSSVPVSPIHLFYSLVLKRLFFARIWSALRLFCQAEWSNRNYKLVQTFRML